MKVPESSTRIKLHQDWILWVDGFKNLRYLWPSKSQSTRHWVFLLMILIRNKNSQWIKFSLSQLCSNKNESWGIPQVLMWLRSSLRYRCWQRTQHLREVGIAYNPSLVWCTHRYLKRQSFEEKFLLLWCSLSLKQICSNSQIESYLTTEFNLF